MSARNYGARVPLGRAVVAQAAAALLALALAAITPGLAADVMAWALLQGLLAAVIGRALGMEIWWLALNALFAPCLVWSVALDIPSGYAFGAFCLLVSVFWGVPRSRVPLFLSSQDASRAVATLLPRAGGFRFLDLGSGFGGMLASLARECPAGRYDGIESAPLPFLFSRMRAALCGGGFRVRWGDLKDLDLGSYDVVYAYLSPAAMSDLWRKASREMRGGSLLISNGFAVPGVLPASTVATGRRNEPGLLLWRM